MKLRLLFIGLSLSTAVLAHGPTPQKTDESVVLDATPGEIWKKITAPCSITKWNAEVAACKVLSDKKEQLTLKNGKTVIQEIDEISNADMRYAYRLGGEIDIAALPISSLHGRITIVDEGGKAKVNWMARYYRAFTGNQPPEGQDDATAKAAIDHYIKTGLAGLKTMKISQQSENQKTASATWYNNFLETLGFR